MTFQRQRRDDDSEIIELLNQLDQHMNELENKLQKSQEDAQTTECMQYSGIYPKNS